MEGYPILSGREKIADFREKKTENGERTQEQIKNYLQLVAAVDMRRRISTINKQVQNLTGCDGIISSGEYGAKSYYLDIPPYAIQVCVDKKQI